MLRRVTLALTLAMAPSALAQNAIHEFRPELVLTLPRVDGYGLQLLVEQHLETSNLAPNERIQGLGLVSPTYYEPINLRFLIEGRQVATPTSVEHRYIPTMLTAIRLGGGWEVRNRTRVEIRDIDADWSARPQDRSALGHDIDIFGHPTFTYGQLDLSYDSRFSTLNRIDKTAGARFAFTKDASIDLFFTRQDDTRRAIKTLFAYGTILRVQM